MGAPRPTKPSFTVKKCDPDRANIRPLNYVEGVGPIANSAMRAGWAKADLATLVAEGVLQQSHFDEERKQTNG